MALKINIDLTTTDGGSISSGAYVRFQTIFPETGTQANMNLRVYRSQQALIDGKQPLFPVELEGYFHISKQLTQEDFDNLTPLSIHNFLKNELESIPEIGIGNVEIVL